MKKCCTCKEEKDESEFSFKSKAKGILNACCKHCHKLYMSSHYQKNKQTYIERASKNNPIVQQRYRDFIRDYKSRHPCKYCGEADPCCLDFHHVTDDKEYEVSRMYSMSLSRVMEE